MKKLIYILFISLSITLTFGSSVLAKPREIKIAIFDNPQPDPSRQEDSLAFVNSYIAGINTAIKAAASKHIRIIKQEFFHTSNLANIIQQAANTKSWKPDAIIGLSTSNAFLMSKAFFGEQVILSISATDSALSTLPKEFYSLGIPDSEVVNNNIKFISQYYPKANLFVAATAESKESVDFEELLAEKFKKQYNEKVVTKRKFLTEDLEHLNISNFMKGYKKDDVIVIVSIGYDTAINLMNRITSHLKPIKPIFIVTTDNWGNSTTPQNMTGSYDAFRIDTLSGGEDTKNYKIFLENYKKLYHNNPIDKISFVTYQAVMSFVDAFIQYPPDPKIKNMREALLNSYQKALKHNPNWFRPPYYVVYKLENQKEVFYKKIT